MIEGSHTCVMPTNSQDHNKMDSKLVGKNILAMVEENKQLTIPTFIAFVRQEDTQLLHILIHMGQKEIELKPIRHLLNRLRSGEHLSSIK